MVLRVCALAYRPDFIRLPSQGNSLCILQQNTQAIVPATPVVDSVVPHKSILDGFNLDSVRFKSVNLTITGKEKEKEED